MGADELTADQNLRLIEPFCRVAARTQDPLVLHSITRGIFETIVEQAPLAIEELMNELEAQEEEEEEETSEGEEQDRAVLPGKPPRGSVRAAEPVLGEEQVEDDDDDDHAGSVLQFDYEAVANRLFEMASHQDTPPLNRKRLYKVIRKLQDLAEGLFPEDEVPEKAYRNPRGGRRVRMKRRLSQARWQDTAGRGAEEASCPEPSPRSARRRRRRSAGADPAVPQEQPGGRGRRGAHGGRRQPRVRPRATVADCQEPKAKRKWTPRGQ